MNDVEASINLFLQADNYKEMFKGDIPSVIDYILPVFRRGDNPYAYTSWAYMNSDASDKFKKTGMIEHDSWWNNGEEVWHIDTVVKKGSDVLPIHRWTSQNIAELKGDKTKVNWVRIGMKDNNFYVKKIGHAYARSELNG